jgi:hypothetical protein
MPSLCPHKVIKDLPLPPPGGDPDRHTIAFIVTDRSEYDSAVTYTSTARSFAENGWAKAAVDVSTPWASANAEWSKEEALANSNEKKTITITAAFRLPRCTIALPATKLLVPHPGFVAAIEEVPFGRPNAREALSEVLGRWGHVLPTEITLGGLKQTTKVFTEVLSV